MHARIALRILINIKLGLENPSTFSIKHIFQVLSINSDWYFQYPRIFTQALLQFTAFFLSYSNLNIFFCKFSQFLQLPVPLNHLNHFQLYLNKKSDSIQQIAESSQIDLLAPLFRIEQQKIYEIYETFRDYSETFQIFPITPRD